jgi:hypothetical protein
MKLKHILIAALGPVIVLALGICIYQSLKRGELSLIGVVVGIYYFIPAILFTLSFVALLGWMNKLSRVFSLLIGQLILSVILCLIFLTLWIVFEGSPYNYRGMSFSTYWIKELKRYWLPLVYFGNTIPVILKILTRNRKSNGK